MAIKHACCASPAHPLLARRAPRLLPRRRQCLPAGDLARFRRGACILEAAADMPGCGAKQPRRHADRRGAGRLLWYSRHPRPDAATPRSRSRARRRLRRWSWCSAAAAGGRNSGVRGANRELARESASEVSDRRPEKSSSAGLVRTACDRPSCCLAPGATVWSTTPTLPLLCLLCRGSWLTTELAVPWPAPECCIAGADGQLWPRRSA